MGYIRCKQQTIWGVVRKIWVHFSHHFWQLGHPCQEIHLPKSNRKEKRLHILPSVGIDNGISRPKTQKRSCATKPGNTTVVFHVFFCLRSTEVCPVSFPFPSTRSNVWLILYPQKDTKVWKLEIWSRCNPSKPGNTRKISAIFLGVVTRNPPVKPSTLLA